MKPEMCEIGMQVNEINDVLKLKGTVIALCLQMNDHNGLVPTAQVKWDMESFGITMVGVSDLEQGEI